MGGGEIKGGKSSKDQKLGRLHMLQRQSKGTTLPLVYLMCRRPPWATEWSESNWDT